MVVISDEDKDIPPFGHLTDYLCFAGIYREMYLYSYPDRYISSFYVNASMSGKLDIHIDYVGETINKPLFQLKKDDKLIKEFKERIPVIFDDINEGLMGGTDEKTK